MPVSQPVLSPDSVREHVATKIFASDGRTRTGVELEWLTSRRHARDRRFSADELAGLVHAEAPLPGGSRLTLEPGGQLELSSPPCDSADEACAVAAGDLFALDRRCQAVDVELVALGADPLRRPERVVDGPRYRAMQRYFDELGVEGVTMMSNTASLQVNVGFGDERSWRERWTLANQLGPVLVAMFANSPFSDGRPNGWRSARFRTWLGLDPSRTAPCDPAADPIEAYTQFALAARVMVHRCADGDQRAPARPCTFGGWISHGGDEGWPDEDDLAYHLTTLFPPVRPRGWLELRMVDALPTPFWQVAVAVVTSLLADADRRDAASEAVAGTGHLWSMAAQVGLEHPVLQRAAAACLDLTIEALERADSPLRDAAARYAERFVARGRCPADDRLDAWRRTGDLFPPQRSPLLEPLAERSVPWSRP